MGKSNDFFNKEEKEKQRLKKKKEKEEKREERKAKSAKGKGFDSMLAYVDENGNISSTPPDPKKIKIIKPEEIQIGISKKEEDISVPAIKTGKVTFFNTSKGYGFIKDLHSQESIFVHIKGLVDTVKENDKVIFDVQMTEKGPNAVNVKLAH